MRLRLIGGTMVLMALSSCAQAAERRIYPCHRLAQAPVMDGKLDDEAWKNIPEAAGFYLLHSAEQYAIGRQTCFKAGWTEDALYLAVRAEEPNPEKMVAKGKDNAQLWMEDAIELFLAPSGAPGFTQFIANSLGSRWNGRMTAGELDVVAAMPWEAKAVVEKTEWFLELRIPFAILRGNAPKEGDEWPVNAARDIYTEPAMEEIYTSWPLLKKGFNEANNFGRFVFKGAAGDKALDEEREMNRSYIWYLHGEIKKFAGQAGKYEKGLAAAKQVEGSRQEAEDLLRIWAQAGKLAAQSDPDWREMRVVRRASSAMRQRCEDCSALGMMEKLFNE